VSEGEDGDTLATVCIARGRMSQDDSGPTTLSDKGKRYGAGRLDETQDPRGGTHNPLVAGSNPARPTAKPQVRELQRGRSPSPSRTFRAP
jgi:hypothetical protein